MAKRFIEGGRKVSRNGNLVNSLLYSILQHKYQINVDGTVAAYRLPYLLVGDSVVLKQDSIYYEHFYNELQPWKHYIPVKSNLSDLLEKLKWARDHDAEVSSVFRKACSRSCPCITEVLETCLDTAMFRFSFYLYMGCCLTESSMHFLLR